MKDSEFIELLNLYVDQEIDEESARRLEAEVQADPNRRRVYRQYCMMHKACALLANGLDLAPEGRLEVIREERTIRGSWGWVAGAGLLAAACFAAVLGLRVRSGHGAAPALANHPSAAVALAQPVPSETPALLTGMKPALSFRAWSQRAGEAVAAPGQDLNFDWISNLRMPSVGSALTVSLPGSQSLSMTPVTLTSSPDRGLQPASTGEDSDSVIGFEFHK
ncbi:MAG: anti-sigma factor family protein [Opitutaceae bacterium]